MQNTFNMLWILWSRWIYPQFLIMKEICIFLLMLQSKCTMCLLSNPGTVSTKTQVWSSKCHLSVYWRSFSLGNVISCGTNRPPELELKNAKGLSNENLQTLEGELNKLAAVRCGEVRGIHTHTHNMHTHAHTVLWTSVCAHLGDDLWASGPHPGLPEWTQQASVKLLPWRDAEEPAEAAGETGPGGAAEDRPAAQTGGGDGEDGTQRAIHAGLASSVANFTSKSFVRNIHKGPWFTPVGEAYLILLCDPNQIINIITLN